MFHLNDGQTTALLPEQELILLGRGEICDIQIDDPTASRVHCRLLSKNGKVFLTDAGSRWGTFVNGVRVQEEELTLGDKIGVGDVIFTLQVEQTPHATTLARPHRKLQKRASEISSPVQRPQHEIEKSEQHQALIPNADRFIPSEFIGRQFGHCRIEELIARSRTGMRFQAFDLHFKQPRAIKFFRPEFFAMQEDRQRFLRAIRTTIDLRHQNLVTLYDAGEQTGVCYCISDFIKGESVEQILQRNGIAGMLDWQTCLKIGTDIAQALQYLEEQHIIHRNLTPANIIVRASDSTAMLTDVRMAKAYDGSHYEQLTQQGDVVGHLESQSPEQIGSDDPIDSRSDMYQLGVVLYSLIAGRMPFEASAPAEIIQKILTEAPVPPSQYRIGTPDLLEELILRLLSKRPQQRFANANELNQQFRQISRLTI